MQTIPANRSSTVHGGMHASRWMDRGGKEDGRTGSPARCGPLFKEPYGGKHTWAVSNITTWQFHPWKPQARPYNVRSLQKKIRIVAELLAASSPWKPDPKGPLETRRGVEDNATRRPVSDRGRHTSRARAVEAAQPFGISSRLDMANAVRNRPPDPPLLQAMHALSVPMSAKRRGTRTPKRRLPHAAPLRMSSAKADRPGHSIRSVGPTGGVSKADGVEYAFSSSRH